LSGVVGPLPWSKSTLTTHIYGCAGVEGWAEFVSRPQRVTASGANQDSTDAVLVLLPGLFLVKALAHAALP
jgi:hypothetical protein